MSSTGYARKEQAQSELQQLDSDLRSWLKHRSERGSQGQYETQLEALGGLIGQTVRDLEQELSRVDIGRDDVYDQCYLSDLRTLWTRRVWHFFREKFDQRDDPVYGPVLRAA